MSSISEEFPIPLAGDTTKTMMGKVKKFSEDFKNLKSSLLLVNQVVNNCTTDRGNLPGTAAQLKVSMDLHNQVSDDLTGRNITAFTKDSASMLSANKSFKVTIVNVPIEVVDNYAPPVNRTINDKWFNVITFRRNNRCTQIACYAFLNHGYDNMIWIRTQHDNSVSAWREI